MKYKILKNKKKIQNFLQKDIYLHLYSIGDLDDFFWKNSTYFGLISNDKIKAIILLYKGLQIPTILALDQNIEHLWELFKQIKHLLPNRFYAHFSVGLEKNVNEFFHLESHGKHYKMALKNPVKLEKFDCSQTISLSNQNRDEIQNFYKTSYPENWFDPKMLETGQYFGIKVKNRLVSIAGIHVYSKKYKVAALGNITTHPDFRGKGLGKIVTAKLCQNLLKTVDHIGLNVASDNYPAISVYKKLGFEIVSSYEEFMVM
ncbi:MAG TPA: GNAT family N-acetyltransferase [Candidatus Cloacimonetes bacterium]|nr:GNAT family N-acetyltransferase [Candidatus Cloacimonadota bacterium]